MNSSPREPDPPKDQSAASGQSPPSSSPSSPSSDNHRHSSDMLASRPAPLPLDSYHGLLPRLGPMAPSTTETQSGRKVGQQPSREGRLPSSSSRDDNAEARDPVPVGSPTRSHSPAPSVHAARKPVSDTDDDAVSHRSVATDRERSQDRERSPPRQRRTRVLMSKTQWNALMRLWEQVCLAEFTLSFDPQLIADNIPCHQRTRSLGERDWSVPSTSSSVVPGTLILTSVYVANNTV